MPTRGFLAFVKGEVREGLSMGVRSQGSHERELRGLPRTISKPFSLILGIISRIDLTVAGWGWPIPMAPWRTWGHIKSSRHCLFRAKLDAEEILLIY
jgi:hypothetical protein